MGIFTFLAEQSFQTDPSGRRIFSTGLPFTRPLVVENAATEARLLKKMTRFNRIVMGPLFLINPVIFGLCAGFILRNPKTFITIAGLAMAVESAIVTLIQWFLFKLERRTLEHSPTRFSRQLARKRALEKIPLLVSILGFGVSVVFVAGGWQMIHDKPQWHIMGRVVTLFFGLGAVVYLVSIFQKLAMLRAERNASLNK